MTNPCIGGQWLEKYVRGELRMYLIVCSDYPLACMRSKGYSSRLLCPSAH